MTTNNIIIEDNLFETLDKCDINKNDITYKLTYNDDDTLFMIINDCQLRIRMSDGAIINNYSLQSESKENIKNIIEQIRDVFMDKTGIESIGLGLSNASNIKYDPIDNKLLTSLKKEDECSELCVHFDYCTFHICLKKRNGGIHGKLMRYNLKYNLIEFGPIISITKTKPLHVTPLIRFTSSNNKYVKSKVKQISHFTIEI
jgi:hypothetical protein